MDRRGVPKHLIDVIRSMYKNTEIIVKIESGEVLNVVTNKRVRQRSSISPILFNFS